MSETAEVENPARYALFKALFLPSEGMSRASVDGLLDAYAHELAEKQRAYARDVGIPLEDENIVSAGDLIDLIDPHVGGTLTVLTAVHGGPCRATLQGWPEEVVDECVREAGHYNEADPESWHQAEPESGGSRRRWSDSASGATPHRAGPVHPDEEPT